VPSGGIAAPWQITDGHEAREKGAPPDAEPIVVGSAVTCDGANSAFFGGVGFFDH